MLYLETNEDLNNLLIAHSIAINNAIQDAYVDLLKCYENNDNLEPYILDELSAIIHLLEVSEDYNNAFKRMDNLQMELSNISCKHEYVQKQ